MEYITRDEAIKQAGIDAVVKAEEDQAEFYSHDQINSTAIYSGVSQYYDTDGFNVVVRAYYEQDYDTAMSTEDLDNLDWTIVGYTVS
jgi:hypothetical protein